MKLLEHWTKLSAAEKRAFAERLGLEPNYLRHVAHGRRRLSPAKAREYHEESGRRVPLYEIRADIYPAPKERVD